MPVLEGYEKFKSDVYNLTKIDLNAYKEKQMKRRIDTLIGKCGKRSDGRSIIIEIIVSFRLNQEH